MLIQQSIFQRPILQRQYQKMTVASGLRVNAYGDVTPYTIDLPMNVDMNTRDGRHWAALQLLGEVAVLRRQYPMHTRVLDEYLWFLAYHSIDDQDKMTWWRDKLSARFGMFLSECESEAYRKYARLMLPTFDDLSHAVEAAIDTPVSQSMVSEPTVSSVL